MESIILDPMELRRQAEEKVVSNPELKDMSLEDVALSNSKLLHELQVHQIELEMQNEHLRQTYAALEASHERFIDLFEFAPVGYVILTVDALIKNINLNGATLLGVNRNCLLNQHFSRLVDNADRDRWQLFFWSLMRFDSPKTIELKLRQGDNTVFYAELNGVMIPSDTEGKTARLALANITKYKQLESVESRCERYQLAEKGSADAIWDWDIRADQIYYAERWYQMLGYWHLIPPKTLAYWESLLHPDDHDETMQRLQQHLQGNKSFDTEYRLRMTNGQYLWVHATGQAVWNEQGQPIRMTGMVRNIHEHKLAEIAMTDARDLAETANRLKSDFLANISHEIRTPMNAIIGMTHLAEKTELTAIQRNYLTKIDYSAHTLLSLINNLLDISKIESGKLELEAVSFSLSELFNCLKEMFWETAQQKNIELSFQIAPQTPPLLTGDIVRLNQVLLNLINNAIKFTRNGKVSVSVEPQHLHSDTVNLRFCVQDEGIGISPEQSKLLFQPFIQADTSITRLYGGTGLGLAISKQLVELMSGSIGLKSELGKGSQFFFTVPFAIPTQNLPQQQITKAKYTHTNLAGLRVLLVEDNELNRELATVLLSELGIQVETAENGKQAVQRVKAESFDCVIMDVQMPVMDGFTATKLIRAESHLQDLPIIAMTAHAMQGDKEKCLAAGMNDYIAKPIDSEKTARTLSHWIHAKPQVSLAEKMPQKIITPPLQKHSDDALPDTLPPFNLNAALNRTQGNGTLLRKLILMFRDDYVTLCEDLLRLITDNDYETAQRRLHNLQGAAMLLEIEELPAIAGAVGQAIKARDLKKMNLLIKALDAVLTPAIAAARTLETYSTSV